MQSHTPNCMYSGHESEEKVTTLNDTIMKCEFPLNICRVIDLNEQKGCKLHRIEDMTRYDLSAFAEIIIYYYYYYNYLII